MDRFDAFSILEDRPSGSTLVRRGGQASKAAYWTRRPGSRIVTAIADLAEPKLRSDALAFYLATMAQGPVDQRILPETLFEDVGKAPAGHSTRISHHDGEATVMPLPAVAVERDLSEATLARRLRDVLLDTARDVVGTRKSLWLETSGGIDSTLMGALARRVLPTQGRLHTISLIYPYYEFRREKRFIDIAVEALGGAPTTIDGASCLSFSDLVIENALSEPSLVLAGLAQHRAVFEAVSEPDALLLNGNGGDSLFALGPDRQPRYASTLARHDWMSDAFHSALVVHLDRLRRHYADHPWADEAAFTSGGDIDDRWAERELSPALGVTRTHLFLAPEIPSLVAALWRCASPPLTGKWILTKHFVDLIPPEILHRPGKVAYNGLYVRAYRAAAPGLLTLLRRHSSHLNDVGISADRLAAHMARLAEGRLEGDLEVSTVFTYLIWLDGWARAGRALA